MSAKCRVSQRWFSLFFGLLGVVGLAGYVAAYPEEWRRVQALSASNVALLSLLAIAGHLFTAAKLRLSATMFGIELPYWEAWMMLESGSLVNVVPLSATGLRALYLKRVHGLKVVAFGLATLVVITTNLVASGVLGILGLLKLTLDGQAVSGLLLGLFSAYLLVPVVVAGFAWRLRRCGGHDPGEAGLTWWHRVYRSLLGGLDAILSQPRTVAHFFLLNLLTSLVICARFWLIGGWLGYPVDFASGLVLQGASQATSLITVLPSGVVGLREAFTGLGAAGLGSPAVSGVLIATLDRIVVTGWTILLGSISLVGLYRRIARAEQAGPAPESAELP